MKTTQPERAYVIEFIEHGDLDQEGGGMPFHLSVLAHSEVHARKRFDEHMRIHHPDVKVAIQHVELSAFPGRQPENATQSWRC